MLKKYEVTASFLSTSRYDTNFTVEAVNLKEAYAKAEEIVNKNGGNNDEDLAWCEDFLGGDGEFDIEVEPQEESDSVTGV